LEDKENIIEEIKFEDSPLNREKYPLLFSLKYILDFYFGEISLNTIVSFSAKSNKGFTQELAIDVIKLTIEDLKKQLNCEKNIFKTPIAPNGLYLARIFYK
jgi:hypothetical protein